MPLPALRCLIVDDSPTFCAAVRDMLESAGMPVVGTASTLDTAVAESVRHRPDVVLVDIDLGDENGFDVVEALHGAERPLPPSVILVSTHDKDDFAEMVEASSAIGFLQKFDLTAVRVADMVLSRSRRDT